MSDETYNGYANRETWAFNLHWQNDQGLYKWVLERAAYHLDTAVPSEWTPEIVADVLGRWIVDDVHDELPELSPELWENMREAVGSFWRIDYAEVGAAVRESLDTEA